MSEMQRRAFKITRLKVSDIEDVDLRSKVMDAFINMQGCKAVEVEKQRIATDGALEAEIATAQRGIATNKLLTLAGDAGGAFDAVRTERVWFIYPKDGDIILESPFTERDMRNALRVQRANLEKQAEQVEGGQDDLYEEGDKPEGD